LKSFVILRQIFFLTLFVSVIGFAEARQLLPTGYPVITNYDHRSLYSGTAQTYNIAEDDRGIIYFGNHVHGVQIWNGVRWDRVSFTNSRGAISLLWHPEEKRMYYTTDFSFGYLDITENNEFVPVDFSHYLESEDIIKERYHGIHYWNGKLLFYGNKQLLSWDGDTIEILFHSESFIGWLHVAGGAFWFYENKTGLLRGDENGIQPFELHTPDGNNHVIGVFETENGMVFVTQSGYLINYHQDSNTFTHSTQSVKPGMGWSRVIRTNSGAFVMTNEHNGLHFFHPDGSLDIHLTEAHGLPTNRKAFLFEDSSGNIWAGGSLGVSVIEYASPMRILSGEQQVPPNSLSMALHNQELFVAGESLYKWSPRLKRWEALSDLPNRILHIRSNGNSLFALGSAGILQYRDGRIYHPYLSGSVYDVQFSDVYEDLIFVIGSNRLRFFQLDANGIIQRKLHETEFNGAGFTIHEDNQGRLWIGTGNRGIHRITYSRNGDAITVDEFRNFGLNDGLPPGNYLYTFKVDDTVFFTTSQQTYAFDEETEKFYPYKPFEKPFDFHIKTPWPTVQDDFNRLWIDFTGRQLGFLDLTSEPPHTWTYLPFRRHGPYRHIHSFVAPSEDILYTVSDFTAARFDLSRLDIMPRTGSAIINRVTLGVDSLLSGPAGPLQRTLSPKINHTREQIRFSWGSTSHLPVIYRRFQTKLEGFDRNWSEWSEETIREYTNLPSGQFTFRVRTRDIYDRVGEEATFTFTVSPPWYASLAAYIMYLIFLGLFILMMVRWRTASLERKKTELENTIRERTREIEAKKQKAEEDRILIEEQADKLKEEQKLRARLFANIAHEFRTPITISQGLVETIDKDTNLEPENKSNMVIVRRNIRRLSNMIDQVIDVTKLDNQILHFRPKVLLAGPFIRRIGESFRSLTDAKRQVFKVESCSDEVRIQTDPDKFETILNNLIFNAIKFTPEEGVITVKASLEDGQLLIRVSDTGPGIPDDQAESIFNRFHRIRNENLPYQEGMGIGLELSRSLARAMEGELTLETGRKKGSCFVFSLPEYKGDAEPEPDIWEEPVSRTQLDAMGLSVLKTQPEEHESRKILLIEDNRDMQAYVLGIIGKLGEVKITENGRTALELLKTWEPSLIISDLMMPEMDGNELVQHLDKDTRLRDIPVIILTAKPFMESKLQLLRAGVVDYITKPFNAEELLLRSRNALNAYSSRKEIRVAMKLDKERLSEVRSDANRVAQYIREHIDDTDLKIEKIAKALRMSRSTLLRAIKVESGMTLGQFTKEIRLQYARQLLLSNPKITLEEITESVGLQKVSWFVKLFEERFGVKPGALK